MNSDLRSRLVALAEAEPDSSVRSQLASSCQRWGSRDALPILSRLSRRDDDATDTHIPNLIWWAFERQLRNDRPAVVALLCTPEAQRGICLRLFSSATARVLASDGTDEDFALCARLLAAAPPDEKAGPIVTGMDLGLEGRRLDQAPPALDAHSERAGRHAGARRASRSSGCAPHGPSRGDRGRLEAGSRPPRAGERAQCHDRAARAARARPGCDRFARV